MRIALTLLLCVLACAPSPSKSSEERIVASSGNVGGHGTTLTIVAGADGGCTRASPLALDVTDGDRLVIHVKGYTVARAPAGSACLAAVNPVTGGVDLPRTWLAASGRHEVEIELKGLVNTFTVDVDAAAKRVQLLPLATKNVKVSSYGVIDALDGAWAFVYPDGSAAQPVRIASPAKPTTPADVLAGAPRVERAARITPPPPAPFDPSRAPRTWRTRATASLGEQRVVDLAWAGERVVSAGTVAARTEGGELVVTSYFSSGAKQAWERRFPLGWSVRPRFTAAYADGSVDLFVGLVDTLDIDGRVLGNKVRAVSQWLLRFDATGKVAGVWEHRLCSDPVVLDDGDWITACACPNVPGQRMSTDACVERMAPEGGARWQTRLTGDHTPQTVVGTRALLTGAHPAVYTPSLGAIGPGHAAWLDVTSGAATTGAFESYPAFDVFSLDGDVVGRLQERVDRWDATTLQPRWSHAFESPPVFVGALADGAIVAVGAFGVTTLDPRDGRALGTTPLDPALGTVRTAAAVGTDIIAAGEHQLAWLAR